MPLFSETEEKILGDVLFDVASSTNITRNSPGAKMRALAEAVSRKMGRMWSQFDLNMTQAFVDGAEGQFLNFLGDIVGLQRLGERPAVVSSLDRNIKFFVESGTFNDIHASAILIPAGTIISTNNNGQGVRYRVPVNTVLPSGASEAYVSVESVTTGANGNVGAKQLIFHNFTAYDDNANDSLKVTNDGDIVSGQDLEIDSNYRFRIVNRVIESQGANPTAVRLAALVVPGVADVVLLPFNRGIGTYDLLIKSVVPSIPDTLVANVQESIDNTTSHGISAKAAPPREVGISLNATITLKTPASLEEQQTIITAATNNVTTYINGLDIGEEFLQQEVLEQILVTSPNIRRVGSLTQPFDKVFIYRDSRLEDNKVRSTLLTDLAPESDERIIVENTSAGNTPILIRISG